MKILRKCYGPVGWEDLILPERIREVFTKDVIVNSSFKKRIECSGHVDEGESGLNWVYVWSSFPSILLHVAHGKVMFVFSLREK